MIEFFLAATVTYLLVGFLFSIPFVVAGAQRIDATAQSGSWGFRLIIVPGVAVFWPVLLLRWLRGNRPVECSAHRDRARRPGRT